jgi:hypothetical protein
VQLLYCCTWQSPSSRTGGTVKLLVAHAGLWATDRKHILIPQNTHRWAKENITFFFYITKKEIKAYVLRVAGYNNLMLPSRSCPVKYVAAAHSWYIRCITACNNKECNTLVKSMDRKNILTFS